MRTWNTEEVLRLTDEKDEAIRKLELENAQLRKKTAGIETAEEREARNKQIQEDNRGQILEIAREVNIRNK